MRLFLSYAREDGDVAEAIVQAAIQEGHAVFYDKHQLRPGAGYHRRIRDEIQACDLFLFLISPDSVEKGFALSELTFAQSRWPNPEGVLLPVMVRETPLHSGHLRTMTQLSDMGAIVAPIVPAFYTVPHTLEEMIDHTVGRLLDLFGIEAGTVKRWKETTGKASGTRRAGPLPRRPKSSRKARR